MDSILISSEATRQTQRFMRSLGGRQYQAQLLNVVVSCGCIERAHERVSVRLLAEYGVGGRAYWERMVIIACNTLLLERVEVVGRNKSHYRLTGKGWALYNQYTDRYVSCYNRLIGYYEVLAGKKRQKTANSHEQP